MAPILRIAAAIAAGAAVMYYLDPLSGRRRRALVRDQMQAGRHNARDYVRIKSRRVTNSVRGALARTKARISPHPVDDDLLKDRVRAKLGHLVRHPGAVEVSVHDGKVMLVGNVLVDEISSVHSAVSAIPGVTGLDNRLSPPR